MRDSNWYSNSVSCTREVSKISSQINDLETEKWKLEHDDYDVYYDVVYPKSYKDYYKNSGMVVGFGLLAALIIYLVKGNNQ